MFGKKMKKMLGIILSVGMLMSVLSMLGTSVSADEYTFTYASAPQVLFYRDYEDYNGGKYYLNFNGSSLPYGRIALATSNAFDSAAQRTSGLNGAGVKFVNDGTNGYSANSGWLINPIKDGKLYIAFDMERKGDDELINNVDYQQDIYFNYIPKYAFNNTIKNPNAESAEYPFRFFSNHSKAKENGAKNEPGFYHYSNGYALTKISDMSENKTYKVELVADVTNKKLLTYIDGTYMGERALSKNTSGNAVLDSSVEYAIYAIGMQFTWGIDYLDNLTMVYYPDNQLGTFSINSSSNFKSAESTNQIKINLKADITDGDYSAPYGISLTEESLNPENFKVTNSIGESLTVSSVEKGEKSGEYILNFAQNLDADKYMITAQNLSDIMGLTLNSNKASAEVEIKDKVIYYETFDGGVAGVKNDYTRWDDKTYYRVRTDKNNNNIDVIKYHPQNCGDETSFDGNAGFNIKDENKEYAAIEYEFTKNIESGVLSYSFDTSLLSRGDQWSAYTKLNSTNASDGYYLLYVANGMIYGPGNNLSGNGDKTKTNNEYEKNKKYNINQIFDLSNKKCYTYVDGVMIGETGIPSGTKVETLVFYLSGINAYFDNLRIQYMSESGESFNISTDGVVENGATGINVKFDDPVTKDNVKKDNFEIKAKDGSPIEITGAEWVDPYTAKLTVDALNSGDYTVSAKNIATVTGATAENTAKSFHVKGDDLYVSDYTENNGVYTATLTNDGSVEKGATLIAGVFKDGALVEYASSDTFVTSNNNKITPDTTDSLTVNLTKANEDGAVVKVFLWDSLGSAKPICGPLK